MKQKEKKRLQADGAEHVKKTTMAVYTVYTFQERKKGLSIAY